MITRYLPISPSCCSCFLFDISSLECRNMRKPTFPEDFQHYDCKCRKLMSDRYQSPLGSYSMACGQWPMLNSVSGRVAPIQARHNSHCCHSKLDCRPLSVLSPPPQILNESCLTPLLAER
ncbi:hypothetical protein TNCT_640911 [Trichonephila clavata]|uniref:Uncharacterized protein n=1 Tax=Trichonephila clavata TaxID=2740835 RepID=A0A8X6IXS8_TRICU|nr:hypothetical protein TNCT_640911 [Trichonephila clavata]